MTYDPMGANALFPNAVAVDNILYDTDSYKLSHYSQYPEGTQFVSSYVEPRRAWGQIDQVMFFGLQIELTNSLSEGPRLRHLCGRLAVYHRHI